MPLKTVAAVIGASMLGTIVTVSAAVGSILAVAVVL
jgi:hypothetical protein